MSFDSIRTALMLDLPESSKAKSSHWKFHTKEAKISSNSRITGINGFSNRTKRFPGSKFLHLRNLKRLYPWAIKEIESRVFEEAVTVCHSQSREIDSCVARHIFTLDLLENYKEIDFDRVCVIGDGQANFVSLGFSRNFCNKLISINLTEVLISDLDLIENLNFLSSNEISVAKSEVEVVQFLENTEGKLLLISAQNARIVANLGINIFINIASFQEMTPAIVRDYFEIIESNSAYLYCCNRVEKKLYGGEINKFFDYPWGNSRILLDESCKWHQESYSLRSPTLFRRFQFDGEIWHRLVKF